MAYLRKQLSKVSIVMIGVDYFNDLEILGASEVPDCRAVLDRRFEGTYSVELMLSGRMRFGIDHGRSVVLDRPAVFWHHPAHTYQYGAVDADGWHHFWVLFRGRRGRRMVENGFMLLSDGGYVTLQEPEPVAELFRALVSLVREGNTAHQGRTVILLERLLCLLAEEEERGSAGTPLGRAVMAVAGAVRESPVAQHDFRVAARNLHVSYSHFRRLFNAMIGESPHAYLLACRMRFAARMLHDPACQIKDVAIRLGYEDPAQFSKLFKKKIGMSPRQYRLALPVGGLSAD